MAPPTMKGLTLFVADIRSCPNKEAEERRVLREFAKIRQKFTSTRNLSGYDRKKYIWKLVYCYTLGYDVDIAHMEIVHLLSSQKYSEKNAGYIACSMLLVDNVDILRLCVNLLKGELTHSSEHFAALALNCLSNVGTAEMAENLMADICRMVNPASGVRAYLRRKAYLCMLTLYRKDPDTLAAETWGKRLEQALQNERDIGCLTSLASLLIGILEHGSSLSWQHLALAAINCLSRVLSGDTPPAYIYYTVPAPWLQVKLLRLLQFFPSSADLSISKKENEIVHAILSKPPIQPTATGPQQSSKKRSRADQDRINRSNMEYSVLFEAMNLAIHLESNLDVSIKKIAAAVLGTFVAAKEANIRYLGLETMSRMAFDVVVVDSLKKHTSVILTQLTEPDVSIRRQALNLLYGLCDKDNWGYIVDELLETLKGADVLLQEELVLKIAILVEKNAPDFTWYVDVVFKMIEYAPECVSDDIWFRVVQVVTGFDDGTDKTELQTYAAEKAYDYLSDKYADETMVKLGAYLLGEFGHHISDEAPGRKQLAVLQRHFPRMSSATKALLLIAYAKLANAHPSVLANVVRLLQDSETSQDTEVQTRACELILLLQMDETTLEKALAMMPTFSDRVQSNNPLIRRMKLSGRSRAHTRKQLEDSTKVDRGSGSPKNTSQPPESDGANASSKRDSDQGDTSSEASNSSRSGGANESDQASSSSEDGSSSESNSGESEGTDSDEGSEEDQSGTKEKSRKNMRAGAQEEESRLPTVGGGDPKSLWKNLCVKRTGNLYMSAFLCLSVVHEYKGNEGKIAVKFINTGKQTTVTIQSVVLQEIPMLQLRTTSNNGHPPQAHHLRPGESVVHVMSVQALQPFLNPPKYLVEASFSGPETTATEPLRLPCSLPIVLTKFVVPAKLTTEAFFKYWNDLGVSGQDTSKEIAGPAALPPTTFGVCLSAGFRLHVLHIGNSLCGAGTFHTATPNPAQPGKLVCVACMCKLNHDRNSNQTRIAVRAAHHHVTSALIQLLAAYFLASGER